MENKTPRGGGTKKGEKDNGGKEVREVRHGVPGSDERAVAGV
jgi:hypothetical protein